jgi:GTP cyclohydrolase II
MKRLFSRKGAKAQRKPFRNAVALCAFAPLRLCARDLPGQRFTAPQTLRYNHPTQFTLTYCSRYLFMEVHSFEKPSFGTCCDSVETGTVERAAVASLPTEWGDFQVAAYRSLTTEEEFVVLFKGEMRRDVPTLVRIHSQCLTGDVFGSIKCDCGGQLHQTMQMIQQEGRGAIVYQLQEGRGIGIVNKIRAYALQDEGADTVEANERLGLAVDLRDYRQCAEILFDLGLCQVKVISNNPLKLRALEEAGLKIVERVSIEVDSAEDAADYLRTKKEKLGHLLELQDRTR